VARRLGALSRAEKNLRDGQDEDAEEDEEQGFSHFLSRSRRQGSSAIEARRGHCIYI
jgi:hypothetical protein